MLQVEKEEALKDIKSKAPKRGPTLNTHYQGCEEAKNLYNQLVIQNRRMVTEISTYKNQYNEHKKKWDALIPAPVPKKPVPVTVVVE